MSGTPPESGKLPIDSQDTVAGLLQTASMVESDKKRAKLAEVSQTPSGGLNTVLSGLIVRTRNCLSLLAGTSEERQKPYTGRPVAELLNQECIPEYLYGLKAPNPHPPVPARFPLSNEEIAEILRFIRQNERSGNYEDHSRACCRLDAAIRNVTFPRAAFSKDAAGIRAESAQRELARLFASRDLSKMNFAQLVRKVTNLVQ